MKSSDLTDGLSETDKANLPTIVNTDIFQQMREAYAEVRVILPGGQEHRLAIQIGGDLADSLQPLPRDRELSFCFSSQQQAKEMQRMRDKAAEVIADKLTATLLKQFSARDPHNGYSPEEWAQIKGQ